MRWLVRDAQPGDTLFISYSGHGGLSPNTDGTEESGFDDTILPADFKTAGEMIDDEVHDILCRPLMRGVRLTAIFDSYVTISCKEGSGENKRLNLLIDSLRSSTAVASIKLIIYLIVSHSCHSGSVCDLPFVYSTEGLLKSPKCVFTVFPSLR